MSLDWRLDQEILFRISATKVLTDYTCDQAPSANLGTTDHHTAIGRDLVNEPFSDGGAVNIGRRGNTYSSIVGSMTMAISATACSQSLAPTASPIITRIRIIGEGKPAAKKARCIRTPVFAVGSNMPAIFVPLQELENLAPATWYVNVLAVMPQYRNHGLGTRLLSLADETGRTLRKRGMSVIVSDANGGARRLYERCGYRRAATRPMVKEGWINEGDNWVLLNKPLLRAARP